MMDEIPITYELTSDLSEALQRARRLIASEADLDKLRTDTGIATGVVFTQRYRLGDYFNSISVTDVDSHSFRITFSVKPKADRRWKDASVTILSHLKKTGVTIRWIR